MSAIHKELKEVTALIRSGDKVAISGSLEMAPMALVREVIRAGVKGLHLVCSGSVGLNADLLVGSGAVETIELSHVMLGESGLAPRFRRLAEQGALRILDHTCPGMASAFTAGAMGIPFIPVQGMLGTDYLRVREDFKLIADPYEPEQQTVVVPAITPDVTLFHAFQADKAGNVIASRYQNIMQMVQASQISIATVEEVVEVGELDESKGVKIPAAFLTAAVHAPYAAHPSSSPGYYGVDRPVFKYYATQAKTPDGFEQYVFQHVLSYENHQEYVKHHVAEKERAVWGIA
ncbi:glutaconate CoA-transferase subunit A [Paenibacillus cellulosilyticus]|uniref:Glutaconate CoA-transferase subunit A n=1 Tax=Paenibacillus cellulosilyticus TaxID=375489 RepID=A0A2V2YWX8_9BACL|nr:CoA-transferase [Paenibacillus cellulosilyticus]PWW03299.1 glutaconate CoA-transferase subunit A [Paenibacillus cellulosilyticus]QKS43775.1 CoA transferase subunit A [Paenibacillus cellulosilyticus]